ncbi:MAG: alcohol dehydrogenase catalytic domain-containing protein [Candidatus Schekmanbacteria bacterium]|nr:alcohol dehydrogenase catalytic domain-containing protein [Candidatus Schekmanbacteria bacterium]
MRGLYFDKNLSFRSDLPLPVAEKGTSLVKIIKAGICNTDIEITKGYLGFDGVPGHEFVGIVEESSNRKLQGKRVVGEINIPCGKCTYCRKELGNHCSKRQVLGIANKWGCFAEYITLPDENLHLITNISDEEAVFVEPLAACLEVLRQTVIKPNARVGIIGDGKLGLLMAQVMLLKTKSVILVGKHKVKLNVASKLGISTIDIAQAKPLQSLKDKKLDVLIDCAGNTSGLEMAIELVKPRGVIVLKSTVASSYNINLAPLVVNEVTVVGSRCGPFEDAIKILAGKKVKISHLISQVFPLSQGVKAIEAAKEKNVIKVLIDVAK